MKLYALPILGAGFLLAACASDPPIAELTAADAAVAEAQRANAGTVAPTSLASASQKLARAHILADDGEEEKARLLAVEARAEANEALAAAIAERAADTEAALSASTNQNAELSARVAKLESELEAKQTERGLVVTIGDVLFATDSTRLTGAGLERVARIATYLRMNPGQVVVIEGHADATGDAAYNQMLSEKRAEAVAAALIGEGIETPRIVYSGLGESSPIATNATATGRQMNRRVEVIFVDRG